MVKRLWHGSRAFRLLLVLAAAALVLAAALLALRREKLPALSAMGIGPPVAEVAMLASGEAWTPGPLDAEGFAQAADNGRFELLVDPESSRIAVRDKHSGYLWRSNPSKATIEGETAKGAVLQNLQSPFTMEVVKAGQTKRTIVNTLDRSLKLEYARMNDGIQVTYAFAKQKLTLVVQYTLTGRGLEVAVPNAGIAEEGDDWIYSLNLLPYFGAVRTGEAGAEGYLFVPDGPGGLIEFGRSRPASIGGYELPIYGADPAGSMTGGFGSALREPIAFPVYGLKRGDGAFAAIVKQGAFTAKVKAVVVGKQSNYNAASVVFQYREEYGRKTSGITEETVLSVRAERAQEDRRVEFRLLGGGEADYVGMAHAYRDYLEASGELGKPLQAAEHVPLMLSLVGGGSKPKFGRSGYESATTFAQAEDIVRGLRDAGVADMTVIYEGWQNSGHTATDERFPIPSALGGAKGAERFVAAMRELGIRTLFEDYMGWKYEAYSSFFKKSDGIRGIDSTVTTAPDGSFLVNAEKAVREQKDAIDGLAAIGADGIYYADGPGSLTFSDYNPKSRLSRADTAFYYRELLDYARQRLGSVGVARGEAYALAGADYIDGIPYAGSGDLAIDETVPFYPIVVHGTVDYSTMEGNLRDEYEDERLKAIEYGAIPAFRLTYEESRALKRTDRESLYSSQYAVWKDRVAEDYALFDRLAGVRHLRIEDHERLAEGVYATTYEDGTKVVVDYRTQSFRVEGGGGG